MPVDPLANPEQLIRRVYSYVAYVVGDCTEAEDLTSETIERALRYREGYDPAKGTPAAWVLGIARRCVAARHGVPAPLGEDALDDVPEPAPDLDDADRLSVRAAVAALPARDRELVALRFGADLTARQIAELLGERTNTVEVALHRALGRLRADLQGDFGPSPFRAGTQPAPDAV